MKKFTKYLFDNIYEGSGTGVIVMVIVSFFLVLVSYYLMQVVGEHNGRVCNYSGKFWVDDSKDKNRDGDLKGCFNWEEMIEMERL